MIVSVLKPNFNTYFILTTNITTKFKEAFNKAILGYIVVFLNKVYSLFLHF